MPECARPRAQQCWQDGWHGLFECAGNVLLLRPGRAHSVQNHRSSRSSFQRGAKVFLYYFVTLLFNFLVKLTA